MVAEYEQKLDALTKEHRHVVIKNKGENERLIELQNENI